MNTDITRCPGVSTDEGELVSPCDRCQRAKPSPQRWPFPLRTMWLPRPPRDLDGCLMLLEVEK